MAGKTHLNGNTTWICKPNRPGTKGGCLFQGSTANDADDNPLEPSKQGCSFAASQIHHWENNPKPTAPAAVPNEWKCAICNFFGQTQSVKMPPQQGCPGHIDNPGLTQHQWVPWPPPAPNPGGGKSTKK